MAFEVYTRQFTRTTEPKITITNLGRFSINNSASTLLKKHPLTSDAVLLLWDKAANKVGIRPVRKSDNRAYPLKAYGPKGRSGTGFSAVPFLNFLNYNWSETRSYPVEWVEGMLVFSIPPEFLNGKPKLIGRMITNPTRKITLED
jgi:hypothetical protein